jgi:dihydroxy-acid dehydratase
VYHHRRCRPRPAPRLHARHGLDDAAIARPFIGIVTTAGDTTPCNGTLAEQTAHAQEGVLGAGGTPRTFTTISVSDGISMNHQGMKCSLVSRDVIADSIELAMRGHAYDGLIGFGGCDKNLPGTMMAMVRCNVPSVFIFGGATLTGSLHGKPVSVLNTYEAAGAVMTGAMAAEELDALERAAVLAFGAAPDNSPPIRWAWSPRYSGLRHSARR